jgi:hypothetical protein
MTKKAATQKKPAPKHKKTPPPEIAIDRRTEWRLDLPLMARVEGDLPDGKKFKEETTLDNISSQGAYFCLNSGVTVGSKLNLIIDVPSELTEGKKVRISLAGITVRLEEPNRKGKKQGVAMRFDEEFQFIAGE